LIYQPLFSGISRKSREQVAVIFAAKPNFFAETLLIEAVLEKLRKTCPTHYVALQTPKIKTLIFPRVLQRGKRDKGNLLLILRGLESLISAFQLIIRELPGLAQRTIREGFLKSLFGIRFGKVKIGDCVFNTYLRFEGDVLRFNWRLVKVLAKTFYELAYLQQALEERIRSYPQARRYFLLTETTYIDEAFRRLLLGKGFLEIIQSPRNGRLAALPERLWGYQLVKNLYYPPKSGMINPRKRVSEIHRFATGAGNYDYMLQKKITTNIKLQHPFLGGEKIAVLFLHLVSDAQYLFGPSCFLDLHDWLCRSVEICRNQGIMLLVKCHPNAARAGSLYSLEGSYLNRISRKFGMPAQIPPDGVIPSKVAGVYFIHPSLSTQTLVRNFPGILFLTHHGTIATEAAYFNHVCLCSSASPYPKNAKFLFQFRNISEYRSLVRRWKNNQLRLPRDAQRELLAWLAQRRNYTEFKNNYFHLLLESISRKWSPYRAAADSDAIQIQCRNKKTQKRLVQKLVKAL